MDIQETAATYGAGAVSTTNLLELIGIPKASADHIISITEGSVLKLFRLPVAELQRVPGIGKAKAVAITAALELGRRRNLEQALSVPKITQSSDAYHILRPHMQDSTVEVFYVLFLDRRNKVIQVKQLHSGGVCSMVVDPKVVFSEALRCNAPSIIVAHNHPSGSPEPSIEDIRLTEKLKNAGSYLDIKVLDHVIVGDTCYYSFADEGKI